MDMKRNNSFCLFVIDLIFLVSWIQQSNGECEAPTLSDESQVIVTPDQSVYSDWSYVQLSCNDGYTEGGSVYSYCYPDTGWNPDPSLFFCYAGCTAPNLTSDTIQYPYGASYAATQDSYMHNDVIVYTCAEGLDGTLVGPDQATCIDGSWEPFLEPYCTDYTTDSPNNDTSASSPTPSGSTSNTPETSGSTSPTDPTQTTTMSPTVTHTNILTAATEDSSTEFPTQTATGPSTLTTDPLDVTTFRLTTTKEKSDHPTTSSDEGFPSTDLPTTGMTTLVTETTQYLEDVTGDVAITTPDPVTSSVTSQEYSTLTMSSDRISTETETMVTNQFTSMSSIPQSHPQRTTDLGNFTTETNNLDLTDMVTDLISTNLVTETQTETDGVITTEDILTDITTASTNRVTTVATELVSKPDIDITQITEELATSNTVNTTQIFDVTQDTSSLITSATETVETEAGTTFQTVTDGDMTTQIQQSLPTNTEPDYEYITTTGNEVNGTTVIFGTEAITPFPSDTTTGVESSTEGTVTDGKDVFSSKNPIPTTENALTTDLVTPPYTTTGYQVSPEENPDSSTSITHTTDADDLLTTVTSVTDEDYQTTNLDTTDGAESTVSSELTSYSTKYTASNNQTTDIPASTMVTMGDTTGVTDREVTTLPDASTTNVTSTKGEQSTEWLVSDTSTDSSIIFTSLMYTATDQATVDLTDTYLPGTTIETPTSTAGEGATSLLTEITSQRGFTTSPKTTIHEKASTIKPTEARKTEPSKTTQYYSSDPPASVSTDAGLETTATTYSPQDTTTHSTTIPGKVTTDKPTEPRKTEPAKTSLHHTSVTTSAATSIMDL
ncbi:cell wall protein DAN4-like [Strongylocentrotus purpuratus]|uniref:Sushi domain-containing protein n=1 Tax=Strongylocentrotus purpuratus TaxID=7668 RepID=A0A7M7NY23_STRPU|nr:cell wall protein DAN4-like [Strongylocentrotus purpuratus]